MNVKKIMKCGKENKSETVKQKAINNQQTTSSKMSHILVANYNVIYPRSKRRSVVWCINQLDLEFLTSFSFPLQTSQSKSSVSRTVTSLSDKLISVEILSSNKESFILRSCFLSPLISLRYSANSSLVTRILLTAKPRREK